MPSRRIPFYGVPMNLYFSRFRMINYQIYISYLPYFAIFSACCSSYFFLYFLLQRVADTPTLMKLRSYKKTVGFLYPVINLIINIGGLLIFLRKKISFKKK